MVDGRPAEAPIGAATEGYVRTPPSFGEAFAAQLMESSPSAAIGRFMRRQLYYPQVTETGSVVPPMLQSPTISAEEANDRFAPVGPDGKKVAIASGPMPERAAQLVGEAKAAEIEREGVLARYAASRSVATTFATGAAAFMLDPLNAATAFIPGIGEEAVLARLGTGLAARMAARVVSGATAGAVAQAPLSALRYGLGQQEASDYGLRDAFRDMLFAAAGNAVFHAGFGALREAGLLKPDTAIAYARQRAGETAAPPPVETPSAGTLPADAASRHDAMRAGIAEIVDGRPVDVMPVVDERSWRLMSEEAQLRDRDAALAGQHEIPAGSQEAAERLARVRQVEAELARDDLTSAERRALSQRRDQLLTDTTPEALHAQARPLEIQRQVEAQRANIAQRLAAIAAERGTAAADAALSPLARLAAAQRELYREGASPGIPAAEGRALEATVYGPKEGSGETTAPAAAEGRPGASAAPGGAEARATFPASQEAAAAIAELEARLKGVELHPEDAAELKRATEAIAGADARGRMMQEAAACLIAGGAGGG